ncbi:MAG: holo-ACP synthase [Spirochaetes bacterium]|nr:holo-ACP synthase [Spirochaetota bacterium]
MILGIGIDVVQVSRMRQWADRQGLLERYFHPRELETALSRGHSMVLSLAARFAAKEAFGKALGIGLRDVRLREIEVRNNSMGKPEMMLHGRAREKLHHFGGQSVHVSMTHEVDNAIAVVIIEGEKG